jgi:N-acetylglutamate synthase-like GNAT family acetyltransferase
MIRECTEADFEAIYEIINDSAEAYRGTIPADRWHEPYISREQLKLEVNAGVQFWGFEEDRTLIGVMGIRQISDEKSWNRFTAVAIPRVDHGETGSGWDMG